MNNLNKIISVILTIILCLQLTVIVSATESSPLVAGDDYSEITVGTDLTAVPTDSGYGLTKYKRTVGTDSLTSGCFKIVEDATTGMAIKKGGASSLDYYKFYRELSDDVSMVDTEKSVYVSWMYYNDGALSGGISEGDCMNPTTAVKLDGHFMDMQFTKAGYYIYGAGFVTDSNGKTLPFIQWGSLKGIKLGKREFEAGKWYNMVFKLSFNEDDTIKASFKAYPYGEAPANDWDVEMDLSDVEFDSENRRELKQIGFYTEATSHSHIQKIGPYSVESWENVEGAEKTLVDTAESAINNIMTEYTKGNAPSAEIKVEAESAIDALGSGTGAYKLYNDIYTSIDENEELLELIFVERDFEEALSMYNEMSDGQFKDSLGAAVSNLEKKAEFEQEIAALKSAEISEANAVEKYHEYEAICEKAKEYENYAGEYSESLNEIFEKFAQYLVYVNAYKDGFDTSGSWYTDNTLEFATDVEISDSKATLGAGDEMYALLGNPIAGTSADEEYWVGLDLSYSGSADGFAGLVLGDKYYFGIKSKGNNVYPYVSCGEEGEQNTETEIIEFETGDEEKIFSMENMAIKMASSSSGAFVNDLTRAMLVTNADGNVIFEKNNIKGVKVKAYKSTSADETSPKIAFSSDLYSWQGGETETVAGETQINLSFTTTALIVPENTNYVRITIPKIYKITGEEGNYYDHQLTRVEIEYLKNSGGTYELYGDEKLEKDKAYSLVLRISNDENKATVYLLSDGKTFAEKQVIFDEKLEDAINTICLRNDGIDEVEVDGITIETADEYICSEYCEDFRKAESNKTQENIEKAKETWESGPIGLMRDTILAMLDMYGEQSGSMLPVVNYISINGTIKEGQTVTAVANVTDKAERLDHIDYVWYVDGVTKGSGESFEIPSGSGGKVLKVEAKPVTTDGEKGVTVSFSDRIYKSTISNGGGIGGGGGFGGGGFSYNGTAPVENTVNQPEESRPVYNGFADVEKHWARNEIEAMKKKGIIMGVSDTRFEPDVAIERAAIAAIVARMINEEKGNAEVSFKDVTDGAWYSEYVEIVASSGIMTGNENFFYPERTITREEMAKVVAEFCGFEKASNLDKEKFSDSDSISEWAGAYVNACVDKGIMKGYEDNSFRPSEKLTRAEAAVIFYRALELK